MVQEKLISFPLPVNPRENTYFMNVKEHVWSNIWDSSKKMNFHTTQPKTIVLVILTSCRSQEGQKKRQNSLWNENIFQWQLVLLGFKTNLSIILNTQKWLIIVLV